MNIEFYFEDRWYTAKLLKKSSFSYEYYHIFLKDKSLIKRFCISFLFAHDTKNGFFNIGGRLFPHHKPIHRSLMIALKLFTFKKDEASDEKEIGKEYNMFYNKNMFG